MKKCNKCLVVKNFESFFADKSHSSGRYSVCKECKKKSVYTWRTKNRSAYNESAKEWRRRHPLRIRHYTLKTYYGLSLEEYGAMLERQNGLCKICDRPNSSKKRLAVDHDHATGKVRSLLCDNCNVALGAFRDDLKVMQKAIEYVRSHAITP